MWQERKDLSVSKKLYLFHKGKVGPVYAIKAYGGGGMAPLILTL